jgi:glyoxylase-like metal-dependent hydrolase (beta-lactamase superfamily II)
MTNSMTKGVLSAVIVLGYAVATVSAQDAKSVIQKAQGALGSPASIQFSGSGKAGTLGQSHLPTLAWPTVNVNSYTRTIDYASGSSREEMIRTLENPPAKGGGAPFQGEQRQVNLVSGQYAWNQPGEQPQPALAAAEERQLQIIVTPHGFLRAAAAATNATAKKSGKNTDVSFVVMDHHRVVGTIDDQGMVTKVSTWIPNPVLGDMEIETTYSDYKDFNGVKFPTRIVQKQGGYMVSDLTITKVQPNVSNAALTAPDAVKSATAPAVKVDAQKLGDGVWWLGGGTHHSIVLDYKDYIAIIEGPLNEDRSLAVIAEAKKLVPNKPIRYLINTHHHFDHSGGVRTYVAEGATIITSEENKAFYERVWKAPRTIDPDRLAKSPKKATFITVKDKYVLSDGTRTLELYRNTGDNHNGAILFGYLPKEKVLIEADDFTPPAPNGPPLVPLARSFGEGLYDNIQKLKLDIQTIAPLHGRVVPFSEMPKALGKT